MVASSRVPGIRLPLAWLILLLSIAGAAGIATAEWSHDPYENNPIDVSLNTADFATAVTDGRGGTIAVWAREESYGSGTYDILPGMTYNGTADSFSWGAQATGVVRIGRNDQGYAFGNRWQVTGWVARKWLPWLSTSFRLAYDDWGNVRGEDDLLNPRLVPTADPDLRAGRRLNALIGVNFLVTRGFLKGNRFAVEAGTPVWQNLRGPQLETDWNITAGWQLAF